MSGPIPIGVVASIVDLTAEGLSTRQIADRLGISPRTVTRWRAKTPLPTPEPLPETPPTVWQQHAACRSEDPAWFVLDDDKPAGYGRGRAVCIRCPVRPACLNDALTREGNAAAADRAGLWGGLSPEQRAALATVRAGVAA